MKYRPDKCPECGGEPVGTVEHVHGLALLLPNGQGGYEYSGYTQVWWDDQKSVTDTVGRVLLQCAEEHQWYGVKE